MLVALASAKKLCYSRCPAKKFENLDIPVEIRNHCGYVGISMSSRRKLFEDRLEKWTLPSSSDHKYSLPYRWDGKTFGVDIVSITIVDGTKLANRKKPTRAMFSGGTSFDVEIDVMRELLDLKKCSMSMNKIYSSFRADVEEMTLSCQRQIEEKSMEVAKQLSDYTVEQKRHLTQKIFERSDRMFALMNNLIQKASAGEVGEEEEEKEGGSNERPGSFEGDDENLEEFEKRKRDELRPIPSLEVDNSSDEDSDSH